MTHPCLQVAVDAPLPEALTYLPPSDGQPLQRGQSVTVPLGSRQTTGIVVRAECAPPEGDMQLKAVLGAHPERPVLPEPYVAWLEWLSQYYMYPLGQIVETVFPPLAKTSKRTSKKSPVVKDFAEPSTPPPLTAEQQRVVEGILGTPGFNVHLLHGVTGSGKTEVYMRLLENALSQERQALVLVPEIALTPQLLDRFSRRFPKDVAVLHSHLTEREKTTQWWSMIDGQRRILLGARSALFCPLERLGLIVLDEEHEPSYKQDEKLKYHARDAAVMLAKLLNIPIVLGSATPSLESWNNAKLGRYKLHQMKTRVNERPLPTVEVVDLRQMHRERRDTPSPLPHWMSERLFEELNFTLERKEQAALFLNRRGVAQTAQCHGCGYVAECPNCSVSLTLHGQKHLVCHYCDYSERLKDICPSCHEFTLDPIGLGTEKIENDVQKLFPEARLARADRDEVQSREELEKLIADVEEERVDILIGTQMIAKGLDFPKLNLVGLVLADVGFHWPDFRASERSFQLITQVSGRSGRQSPGKVIVQTYDPEHISIRHSLNADYVAFAESELFERSGLLYPPHWRMALFRIQSTVQAQAEDTAEQLVQRAQGLQRQFASYGEHVMILGPAPAPLLKLRNKFRYQVIVKCDQAQRLNHFCRQILGDEAWILVKTKVQVDIDPSAML